MNAGDVSSVEPVAHGITGVHSYNIKNENGSHRPHTDIKNSYSGQSWVGYTKTNGPIIGFFFKDHGLSVEKTFYNKDRYVMIAEDKTSIDPGDCFSHGVAKSHNEMTSQHSSMN